LTWGLAGLIILGFLRGRNEAAAALEAGGISSKAALGGRSAAR
jgi:hypothetical protein